MYDSFVDEICKKVGNISETTFADIGCNSGYFPVSFSLRGAKDAVGYDRADHSLSFKLLNDVFGTKAKFVHKAYSGFKQKLEYRYLNMDEVSSINMTKRLLLSIFIANKKLLHKIEQLARGKERYDVVVSIAVLCHLSDPLQHLAFLGSIARKAIFIWTPVTDDDYCIKFGEPNKYYKSDKFPLCFDNNTRPSAKLLRKSLELMGFTEIYEIPNQENGMSDSFYNVHKAILAIRP